LQRSSVSLTFPLWDTFQVVRLMMLLDAGNLHKASPKGKRPAVSGAWRNERPREKGLSEHIGKVLYRK